MYTKHYIISDELYHHGVIGQKWGVRRYQSYAVVPRGSGKKGKEVGGAKRKSKKPSSRRQSGNSLSRFGKGAARTTGRLIKGTAKVTGKLIKGSAKVTKKAYTTARNHEKIKDQREREEIVKSGNAKLVYKNRHRLSDKELNDAINRINTERRVKDLKHGNAYRVGQSVAKDIIGASGKTVAKQALIGLGIYGAQKATRHIIKGTFNPEAEHPTFVNPTMYIKPPKSK